MKYIHHVIAMPKKYIKTILLYNYAIYYNLIYQKTREIKNFVAAPKQ